MKIRNPTISEYRLALAHPQRQVGGRRTAGPPPNRNSEEMPLVSIITMVRDERPTIERTICSVTSQAYENIEHIVIDGGSKDGTIEVLRAHDSDLEFWLSEPDSGTAEAANKALAQSQGKFIFFLSANDWIDSDFIKNAVETLVASGADFVFGDVLLYRQGAPEYRHAGAINYASRFVRMLNRLNLNCVVVRRSAFERIGLYRLDYKVANDTAWFIQLHAGGGRGIYDPRLCTNCRTGGLTDIRYYVGVREVGRALLEAGFPRAEAMWYVTRMTARRVVRDIARHVLPECAFRLLMNRVRRSYSKPLKSPT
jgi:glycosyltransferase involved in cell wall biosynthesis